ncbi:IS66 family transposase zinc-finger binding domain-containing protein [Mesorhizobium sp. M0213]|uniref:IS66 family transposase n=1 Tax=Mesorhizobium sp. M0213 TaxID=2956917 RepID=UPI003339F8FA
MVSSEDALADRETFYSASRGKTVVLRFAIDLDRGAVVAHQAAPDGVSLALTIARLTAVVKMLERSRFGSRSERLRAGALSEEQYALVFDEIETGVAAIEAQMEKSAGGSKAKRAPRPRKGFAAHLERIEVVIEPETPAGCEALEKILIGEDVSERLDVTPAKFRVIVTRRPKYAYKGLDGIIQAAAPARIIESGIPTEALLAQIAVSKYADGLPLYRQEAIYARDQARSTGHRWRSGWARSASSSSRSPITH